MITCVVSGASRGIGREIVLYLLKEDCRVVALSRNKEALIELNNYKTYEKIGGELHVLKADISDDDDLERVKNLVFKSFDHINVLINNAGLLINKPFSQIRREEFESVFKANVWGALALTQVCHQHLLKGDWGHVVNISSVGGVGGSLKFPGLSIYSSSKGAMSILGECLSEELKESNIVVNNLALGAVQTEMLEEAFPGYQAKLSAKEMAEYIGNFALNNWRWMNGKTITVSLSNP